MYACFGECCLASSLSLGGRWLLQVHGDSTSCLGMAVYFVKWQVVTILTVSVWVLDNWREMPLLKQSGPVINTQMLLRVSFRLNILSMFETKLNANSSYSGVLSEHQEMFKV